MDVNQEYIALLVSDQGESSLKPKRSLWRTWNQLSRLQRSLVYITLILCGIILLYVIQGPNWDVQSDFDVEKLRTERSTNDIPEIGHVVEEDVHGVLEGPGTLKHKVNEFSFTGPSNIQQMAVVKAFKHAWKGYKKFAWGHDHLKPISGGFSDWFGVGLTIVDSLDTMYIMGLEEEYKEARDWVEKELSFKISTDVNLFEITIRVLGGLLSIYHLTDDKMYLNKARDLGERLLPSFNTESGIPFSDINLLTGLAHAPKWSPDSSTSEVTTIQLEFRDLSRCTGDPRFEKAAARVSEIVHELPKTNGLVPIFINAMNGNFRRYSTITMGARGDSYYEYLLKQWIQTGKTIDYLKEDYLEAIEGAEKLLIKRTSTNVLFIGELLGSNNNFKSKMDHLTCYLSGTLALGVHYGLPQHHLSIAEDLLNTCFQMYARQPTFLAPEITYFTLGDGPDSDMYVKYSDSHNLLRPEFIESLWYMSELVPENRTIYRKWGWKIFEGFEKYTKVKNGYTSIENVRSTKKPKPLDKMESFFLAETLKYFYLLFSDESIISLDQFLLNTEGHLLPINIQHE